MAQKQVAPSIDPEQAKLYVWVKALEIKVNNLLKELDLLKNDFIKKNVDMKKEVKTLNSDILELKHQQDKSVEKMDLIIKELKRTAGQEELMTLKKYIDFWNPMNFVTQRDLDRAIEKKLNPPLVENEEQTNKKEKHLPFV